MIEFFESIVLVGSRRRRRCRRRRRGCGCRCRHRVSQQFCIDDGIAHGQQTIEWAMLLAFQQCQIFVRRFLFQCFDTALAIANADGLSTSILHRCRRSPVTTSSRRHWCYWYNYTTTMQQQCVFIGNRCDRCACIIGVRLWGCQNELPQMKLFPSKNSIKLMCAVAVA